MEPSDKLDVPQGTLELMILTILAREPLHGYGVSQKLAALSGDAFRVNPGSLFPLLYRLEQDGKLKAEWGASDNNRQAKFYRITAAGTATAGSPPRALEPRDAGDRRRAGGRMTILSRWRPWWRGCGAAIAPSRASTPSFAPTSSIVAAEKVRAGVPPDEARRQALLELGGIEPVKEQVRRGRHGGLARRDRPRRALRDPPAAQDTGVHQRGRRHAGARHWGQHRDLQRDRRADAALAAGSIAGAAGAGRVAAAGRRGAGSGRHAVVSDRPDARRAARRLRGRRRALPVSSFDVGAPGAVSPGAGGGRHRRLLTRRSGCSRRAGRLLDARGRRGPVRRRSP